MPQGCIFLWNTDDPLRLETHLESDLSEGLRALKSGQVYYASGHRGLSFSPDGQSLLEYASGKSHSEFEIWDIRTRKKNISRLQVITCIVRVQYLVQTDSMLFVVGEESTSRF